MTSDRVHMGLQRVRIFLFGFLILGGLLSGWPGEMDAAAQVSRVIFAVSTQDDLVPGPTDGKCDYPCSLREAIEEANALDHDLFDAVIYVPTGIYKLGDQLAIKGATGARPNNVYIEGEGVDQTVLDGNHTTRVIDIAAKADVKIRYLTIQNGWAIKSAVVPAHYHGGGIHNHGTLHLENGALSDNYAPPGGGGGCAGACGGGLYNAGTATLTNVTVAENGADIWGGGIANGSDLGLYNVTLANNLASNGGGLYNAGTTRIFSSIVANNDGVFPGNNCSGNLPQNGMDNLQFSFSAPNPQSCGNNIPTADPGLDAVRNADGGVIYYRLYYWSPAVDVVPLSRSLVGWDVRGLPRPQDGNGDGIVLGDVGAYERRPIDP